MYVTLAAVAFLVSGSLPAFAGNELRMSAGVSAQQNVFAFVTKAFEESSGIKVIYTNKDPKGQGGDAVFREVDQGVAEAGASGTDWDDWVKMIKDKGYVPRHLDEMKSRVFGRDRIQVMTYKGGPAELSEEQLKGILRGKYRNWKEVGGEDQPITLIESGSLPLTSKFLEERFLHAKLARENGKIIDKSAGPEGMVKAIAGTRGSIGFGPVNLVNGSVNVPKTPVIGRPITMIWLGKPSPALLQFLEFIDKEGAKLGVVQ